MKQIKDMNLSEVKQLAIGLEFFARDARVLSEGLLEIVYDEDAHKAVKEFAADVSVLERTLFALKNTLDDSHDAIEEADVIDDARVFVRHMMMLCKNISVNLSYRFNNLFGWTELDVHEVLNGFVDDKDLG